MILDEKRAFKRVSQKFTIKYKVHGRAKPQTGHAVSENISFGGLYFISLRKFEIGQLIDCFIEMPPIKKNSKWTARVVRCENLKDKMVDIFGVAVEFVKSFGKADKNLRKVLG